MLAEGQPQPPEFETFESLNLGQPSDLRPAELEPGDNQHYEELRQASTHDSRTFP